MEEKSFKKLKYWSVIVLVVFLTMPFIVKYIHDSSYKDIEYKIEAGLENDVKIVYAKANHLKGVIRGEYNTEKVKYIQIRLYNRLGDETGIIYSDLTKGGKIYEQLFYAKDVRFAYITQISNLPGDKIIDGTVSGVQKANEMIKYGEEKTDYVLQKYKLK